jgi:hypothetical protein
MGGQQLLEWAIEEPELFEHIVPLATNAFILPGVLLLMHRSAFVLNLMLPGKKKIQRRYGRYESRQEALHYFLPAL